MENKIKYNSNNERRLYAVWNGMRHRCYDVNKSNYKYYGGRGIKVCDEWKDNFNAFAEWAYRNGYSKTAEYGACTLDRINYDGDYCPNNCRWVDVKTQNNNKRKYKGKIYEYKGEKHTLKEWAKIIGTCYHTLNCRITQYGMNFEEAITMQTRKSGNYYGKTD